MKMKLISAIVVIAMLSACAGRQAVLVPLDQAGDNQRSCAAVEMEMTQIQSEMRKLIPESDKTAKNVGLGIAGAFLIVPWFFMDLKDSEKAEINAYQQRYNKLSVIAKEKNCSFQQVTPDSNQAKK